MRAHILQDMQQGTGLAAPHACTVCADTMTASCGCNPIEKLIHKADNRFVRL